MGAMIVTLSVWGDVWNAIVGALNWFLQGFFSLTGNYGVAIILLTLMVKVILWTVMVTCCLPEIFPAGEPVVDRAIFVSIVSEEMSGLYSFSQNYIRRYRPILSD